MSLSPRVIKLRRALEQRLGRVACAVQAVYHRHNVSAILRTCDALGLHDVHLVEGHFKAARGPSKGAERWLALHHHPDPETGVQALLDAGYRIWVADLAEPPTPPEAVPVDEPVCIWMGAELEGVHPAAREAAAGVVTVPMYGLAQSLNVSVAAALTLGPVAANARALGPDALLPRARVRATWEAWIAREERLRHGIDARRALTLPDEDWAELLDTRSGPMVGRTPGR